MLIVIDYDYMSSHPNSSHPSNGRTNGFRNGITRLALERDEESILLEERERHREFVAALERASREGSNLSQSSWVSSMAFDLNWDEEEVELYAYRYFTSLIQQNLQETYNSSTRNLEDSNFSVEASNQSESQPTAPVSSERGILWSDEDVNTLNRLSEEIEPPASMSRLDLWVWAEQISERMTGKSSSDILSFWLRHRGNGNRLGDSNLS